ncbi:GNAT family N-acetyltransferase [Geodermatophilus sp. DSM 45219]|uniref:GNAT family N-acetyltransferase n=1 Tax=Geodermatophilus sp. DSM 45219 TaxID=1881103 RepID=UPI00088866DF|nr:GNAT family N-acetyltransferase [Geodermatophilus sp. DSM 45219]SDO29844.1 L-amino acid N-acyltransferase YncA [Geodermatophilus sp. DSM 45219]
MTAVAPLTESHGEALVRFFAELPEGDRTFIREDVTDPDVVRGWSAGAGVDRWVAVDDGGRVLGYVAVLRLPGWSDHVGEVRLVVAPAARGSGQGRALARHAVVAALEAGLSKLVVEVVADQTAALALFTGLGFTGEALLVDHIRDREGQLRDLMVLAHHVGETWAGMRAVGLTETLDDPT